MNLTKNNSSWLSDIIFICFIVGLAYFITLGIPPLFTPDEGRYAEIPREMLANSDFIIPHLNGIIYFEKPPLLYWITALSIHLFGYSEWAVRLWNGLLALGGCVFMYVAARKLFNRRTGLLASLILASNVMYFSISHILTTDMLLSFCLMISLLSFILGMNEPRKLNRSLWLWLAYAMAGFAFLSKGLIGIVFPGLIIGLWVTVFNQWSVLTKMRLLSGLALFLIIILPWMILAQMRVPSFLNQFILVQEFERFTTPIMNRSMSFSSYCAVFLLGFFPWIALLIPTLKFNLPKTWKTRQEQLLPGFFVIWFAAIFLFFAFSHSILIPYLLPIIAPLALLSGRYLDHCFDLPLHKSLKRGLYLLSLLSFIIAVALPLAPLFQPITLSLWIKSLLGLGCVFGVLISLSIVVLLKNNQLKPLILLISICFLIFMNIIWLLAPYFSERSIKVLAQDLNTLLPEYPQATVVTLNNYYQDLPYYIQKTVVVVNWTNELTYGSTIQPEAKKVLINDTQFWHAWQQNQPIFAVMSKDDYQNYAKKHPMHLIDQTYNDDLVTNIQLKS